MLTKHRARILLLSTMVLLAGACHKRIAPARPPPSAPPDDFQLAEKQFEAGDYAAATRAYTQYLRRNPPADRQAKALFRLGLAHALPGSGVHDLPQAMRYFRQLLTLAPKGPYQTEVGVILGLHAELEKALAESQSRAERIKTLTGEMEKLKKIDLQKRPPIPPE